MTGLVLILGALALIAVFIYHLVNAPLVDEDNCPVPGMDDCGGPCVENPPCVDRRHDFP